MLQPLSTFCLRRSPTRSENPSRCVYRAIGNTEGRRNASAWHPHSLLSLEKKKADSCSRLIKRSPHAEIPMPPPLRLRGSGKLDLGKDREPPKKTGAIRKHSKGYRGDREHEKWGLSPSMPTYLCKREKWYRGDAHTCYLRSGTISFEIFKISWRAVGDRPGDQVISSRHGEGVRLARLSSPP